MLLRFLSPELRAAPFNDRGELVDTSSANLFAVNEMVALPFPLPVPSSGSYPPFP